MSAAPLLVVADDPGRTGAVVVQGASAEGAVVGPVEVLSAGELAGFVARTEQERASDGEPVRWVWDDTARRYPPLLAAGVRVERCHDLRLCHALLRRSARAASSDLALAPEGAWDWLRPPGGAHHPTGAVGPAGAAGEAGEVGRLFDLDDFGLGGVSRGSDGALDVGDELVRQLAAVAGSPESWRLRLLCAAESTGALLAAEMAHDGLPWSVDVHDRLLTEALGPRPPEGRRPVRLEELADRIRTALDRPGLNPDSQQDLLGAMRSAGLAVSSTRKWEIEELDHPVREPLLEYKRLARLLGANGWVWMEQWVRGGRYRAEYVPAGVVSGRWATSGGGALQLPAAVRGAVVADPGWALVVADASQLEPRVLAAMSGDQAMAAAARQADLYEGLVSAGVVASRRDAKYAMLGAIYGATTGQSGALVPRLTAAFPEALGLVEAAARAGERGEAVSTWLGRTSPRPGEGLLDELAAASSEGADAEAVRAARRRARDWGRFTRNFVVQGTAAEWALCWMAALRRRLRVLGGELGGAGGAGGGTDRTGGDRGTSGAGGSAGGGTDGTGGDRGTGGGGGDGGAGGVTAISGYVRPHLVFFLHDEVIVHTPAALVDEVAQAVREAAVEAGRLLFGTTPVEFPLDLAVVESYDQAG